MNYVKLSDKQKEALVRRAHIVFEQAFADETNANSRRNVEGVDLVSIRDMVEICLKKMVKAVESMKIAGNYDPTTMPDPMNQKLIDRTQNLIQGHNGNLDAVEAKFRAIKASTIDERESDVSAAFGLLRKKGYAVTVTDNIVVAEYTGSTKDKLEFYVQQMKECGFKVTEITPIEE